MRRFQFSSCIFSRSVWRFWKTNLFHVFSQSFDVLSQLSQFHFFSANGAAASVSSLNFSRLVFANVKSFPLAIGAFEEVLADTEFWDFQEFVVGYRYREQSIYRPWPFPYTHPVFLFKTTGHFVIQTEISACSLLDAKSIKLSVFAIQNSRKSLHLLTNPSTLIRLAP